MENEAGPVQVPWSTMAHARDHGSKITKSFNAAHDDKRAEFKAKRLGSQMVQRGRPHPVLKPSPKLANGPDREAHHNALAKDHQLARLIAARDRLHGVRNNLDRADKAITKAQKAPDTPSAKQAFKAARQTTIHASRTINQTQSVTR